MTKIVRYCCDHCKRSFTTEKQARDCEKWHGTQEGQKTWTKPPEPTPEERKRWRKLVEESAPTTGPEPGLCRWCGEFDNRDVIKLRKALMEVLGEE